MAQIDATHARGRTPRLRAAFGALALVLTATACLSGRHAPSDGGVLPTGGPNPVQIGIPDPETGNGFIALAEGGDVVVNTFGQGGHHAELALACSGFGNGIYPQFIVENLDGEGRAETPPFARPQPVPCDEEGRCIRSPNYVMLGGLAEPDTLDGLHVRITALCSNDDGLMGEATVDAFLRAPDGVQF